MGTRIERAGWGVLGASVATSLALIGHLLGGGALPAWQGIAVPWLLSVGICIALAGQTLSIVRATGGALASQLLFHTLFMLGTPATASHSAHTGHSAHAGHGSHAGTFGSIDTEMWLTHLVAAALTVVIVHRGERNVLRLYAFAQWALDWVRHRLGRSSPSHILPQRSGHQLNPDFGSDLSPLGIFTVFWCRRGPPAALLS